MDNVVPNNTVIIGACFPVVIAWGIFYLVYRRLAIEPRTDFFSSGAVRAATSAPHLVVPNALFLSLDDARTLKELERRQQEEELEALAGGYDSEEEAGPVAKDKRLINKSKAALASIKKQLGSISKSTKDRRQEAELLEMFGAANQGADGEIGGLTAHQLLKSLNKFEQEEQRQDEAERQRAHKERIEALKANSHVVSSFFDGEMVEKELAGTGRKKSGNASSPPRRSNPFSDDNWQFTLGESVHTATNQHRREILEQATRTQNKQLQQQVEPKGNKGNTSSTGLFQEQNITGLQDPLLAPLSISLPSVDNSRVIHAANEIGYYEAPTFSGGAAPSPGAVRYSALSMSALQQQQIGSGEAMNDGIGGTRIKIEDASGDGKKKGEASHIFNFYHQMMKDREGR